MWHYGLVEGASADVPAGCEILEVATYVCPFASDYVGCVMLIKAEDGHPAPFVMVLNAMHKETEHYFDHVLTDNLFIALMEFENGKCAVEVAVNACATAHVTRISRWN